MCIYNHIAKKIRNNEKEIKEILLSIENEDVVEEEIKLSLFALENSDKYLSEKAERICAYLPMNLPLYSLITYVIIPKKCAKQVVYRPSNKVVSASLKIHDLLGLDNYDLKLVNDSRDTYFREYVKDASVVIFVGKPENANDLKSKLGNETLFIYFGVGQNPIVIEKDADLNTAVKKVADSVLFNYGQDCSKPNAIFVNKEVHLEFLKKLKIEVSKHKSAKTQIKDTEVFVKLAELLTRERNNIVLGGTLDVKDSTLDPIIISKEIELDKTSFNEYYAPVFRIYSYDNVNQLKQYFSSPNFKKENMNISLFGTSEYIDSLPNSIILENNVVLDEDNGISEFGGFGDDVSYLKYRGITVHKPMLINREIKYFYGNSNFRSNSLTGKEDKILKEYLFKEYNRNMSEIFGNNILFSFVFGSHAKKISKRTSDVDMLVCLKEENKSQIENFREWYFEYHYLNGLKPDKYYPGEVITEERLNNILENNEKIELDILNSCDKFDVIFYTQIFSDKKREILGDNNKLHEYENKCKIYTVKWCRIIFELLNQKGLIKDEKDYMRCLTALASNDLLFFSKRLNFEQSNGEKYNYIIDKIDGGLLKKELRH